MRAILVVSFALALSGPAYSQPGPLRDPSNQSPDNQQIRGNDALEAISSQLSEIRQQAARIEQQRADAESDYWPPDWPGWLTVIVTGLAVLAAFVTLGKLERQTKAAKRAARAAKAAALAAADTLATNQEIERAYIVMGHKETNVVGTPDDQGGRDRRKPRAIKFTVNFTNVGRTPGDLLGGAVGYNIGPEPRPDITRMLVPQLTRAYLYPTKQIDFHVEITEDETTLVAVMTGDDPENRLWLTGILDYRDRFGNFHTAGYCRCWHSTDRGYGFAFTQETGSRNYDRPMPDFRRHHYALDRPEKLEW